MMLTHWGRVMHICVSNLSHHWFRKWLVDWPVPSHYLTQCWDIVNWPLRNIQWNFNRNSYIFIPENAFWKCRPENGSHFVSSSMCYINIYSGNGVLPSSKIICINVSYNYTDAALHLYGMLYVAECVAFYCVPSLKTNPNWTRSFSRNIYAIICSISC